LLGQLEIALAAAARRAALEIAGTIFGRAHRIGSAADRLTRSAGIRMARARAVTQRPARARADELAPFLDPTLTRAGVATIAAKRSLSPRQVDVLTALVAGVPRRYLANVLRISEHSVKTHVKKLLRALRQRDVDRAVWWVRTQIAKV
jgi:DNA-binding NarL/FixJ family response regulator